MTRNEFIICDEFVIEGLAHAFIKHFYHGKQRNYDKALEKAKLIFDEEFRNWMVELRNCVNMKGDE